MSPGSSDSIGTRRPSAFVTSVLQRRQLLEPEPDPDSLPDPLPLVDEPLPDGVIDSVELLLELLDDELPQLDPPPDVPPPPDAPPPPLEEPPPPLDEPPPPEELPPPPLDDGVPSVLSEELDGLLDDGVAVSVLLLEELDAVSVELSVGVPGSLELGVSLLLLKLDVPLPGGDLPPFSVPPAMKVESSGNQTRFRSLGGPEGGAQPRPEARPATSRRPRGADTSATNADAGGCTPHATGDSGIEHPRDRETPPR